LARERSFWLELRLAWVHEGTGASKQRRFHSVKSAPVTSSTTRNGKPTTTTTTAKKRQQRPLFPRGKVHQVSLLEQGGGRLRAGDSDHCDHRDRKPLRPHGHMDIDHMDVFVVVVVRVRVESECRQILPGLSRPLCVVATYEWPNRDRLTASQVVAGT
jgi:hypothetical protein